MSLGPKEIQAVFALHRYLLNHGVIMIPYGLMVLSTAMTEADVDFMVEQALGGMREIAKGAK
jgi:glutamate-1-semialdehyde aminotransferase